MPRALSPILNMLEAQGSTRSIDRINRRPNSLTPLSVEPCDVSVFTEKGRKWLFSLEKTWPAKERVNFDSSEDIRRKKVLDCASESVLHIIPSVVSLTFCNHVFHLKTAVPIS